MPLNPNFADVICAVEQSTKAVDSPWIDSHPVRARNIQKMRTTASGAFPAYELVSRIYPSQTPRTERHRFYLGPSFVPYLLRIKT